MDNAVEAIKAQITEKNQAITQAANDINALRNENIKLTEQKKQLDMLKNQLKLAEEREAQLMEDARKIKELNDSLKQEINISSVNAVQVDIPGLSTLKQVKK